MSVALAAPPAPPGPPPAGLPRAATLEDLVLASLRDPEAVGCPVCAGPLRPVADGHACADCGSVLARGAALRRVVRPIGR